MMPHEVKLIFYILFLLQTTLHFTFTNSAVIRREQRSIPTNGTILEISADKELEPVPALGLEENENLLLETVPVIKHDTTTKSSLQENATTLAYDGGEKKEDTTSTGQLLDENTVSLSSDGSTKPSKAVIKDEKINEKVKSEKEEPTTITEFENTSTSAPVNNESITTITPVIENDTTTSKPPEKSKSLSETTTNSESIGNKKDAEIKETTLENVDEDTTQIPTTIAIGELSTNVNANEAATVNSSETTTTETITTIPEENDLKLKESETTNLKLKETDKVTESFQKEETIDTSTELADNDVSKPFVTSERKQNRMLIDKEMTTEPVNDKLPYETSTQFDETTQTSMSNLNETVPVLQGDKQMGNLKTPNASSTEKRGKFISHNYSSFNDFHLPNTSDVWALASLRSVGKSKSSELPNSVETSEEKPLNTSVVTKSLHDWTRVMDNTHDMESKTHLKIEENTEDSTTEIASTIMVTTPLIESYESNTTIKSETNESPDITTELPLQEGTTMNLENKTTKAEIDSTTSVDNIEKETTLNPAESQSTNNDLENSTDISDKSDITDRSDKITTETIHTTDTDFIMSTTSSLFDVTILNKTIEENKVDGDNFKKVTIPQPTTTTTTITSTTTTTPIPQIVTMKTITTDSQVDGETTLEVNAGTTSLSTSSLSDFTSTPTPLLTTSDATPKTTMEATTDVKTTTPAVILSKEYEENEFPNNTVVSILPTQNTSPVSVTMDSSAATTSTTTKTIPAVLSTTQAISTKTQTTEAPHTPAIISNDTTATIQKSKNNYNEYEVVNKSTENYTDNSSTEAFEATTRVGVKSNWSTNSAEISTTTEVVDKLDEDLDVTTNLSSFEANNNANDIESTITTTVIGSTVTLAPKTHPIVTDTATEVTTENLDHIDPDRKISDTAETSIESNVIDPLQVGDTSTAATTTTSTASIATTTTTPTETNQENMKMPSTERGNDESVYLVTTKLSTTTTTSTPNYDESATTFESISTKKEDVYSIVPTIDNAGDGFGEGGSGAIGNDGFNVPKLVFDETTPLIPSSEIGVGSGILGGGGDGGLQPMDSPEAQETDVNVIIAISVSTVGIIALILLVAFLYVMRKRQKQMSYGQRCRPVSLDAYSLDNVSVYNSVRRKGATLRASKRSYGNVAFDDPSLRHNVLGTHELARYVEKKSSIWEEFKEVPQIIARADEVPAGCEDKNRYANVIPLPETRVILQQQNGDEKTEYINANYVRGPKDTTNYYIACQAPLETTVTDFWRMIWEQNSRVIIMATDLIENGIDKCAEYLPPSVTLDNHTVFGDYQVTLKHREVKEKYAISTLMLKNTVNDESREITHYWYQWPETGVPTDEAAIIAMLLEARSSLKAYAIEQSDIKIENLMVEDDSSAKIEINGNVTTEKPKPQTKDQGPLTIHCSPGTGRTGTILACDIAMRCLEEPKRTVDIPQIVYSVRRGRASAVQTKEQYEFIYKVTHMYATKISNINNDN